MKKHGFILLACVIILMAGCSSANVPADVDTMSAEVAEGEQDSGKDEEKEHKEETENGSGESLKAAEESLKAAEESIKAAEESLKAAEESIKAAESSMAEEQEESGITYSQLVSSPEKYENKNVSFSGKIIRSAAVNTSVMQIVLAVNGSNSTRLVGEYPRNITGVTLATGDQISMSGWYSGIKRYRMDSGRVESLPMVEIEEIRDIVKAVRETQPATEAETSAYIETTATMETAEPETEIPEESGNVESGSSPVISAGES